MNYTENLQLKKPEATDYYNIEDFNENADTVDEMLGEFGEYLVMMMEAMESIARMASVKLRMYAEPGTVVHFGVVGESGSITQAFDESGVIEKNFEAGGDVEISYSYAGKSYARRIVTLERPGVHTVALAPQLADASWTFIDKVGGLGLAQECWSVGDTRKINLGSVEYTVRILGFEHDRLADAGTGNGKRAAITFGLTTILAEKAPLHKDTTVEEWAKRDIFTTYLPARKAEMPSELQGVIKRVSKAVMKPFDGSAGVSGYECKVGGELLETELFLFSERELFGEARYSNPYYAYDSIYEYYARGGEFVLGEKYWLRSVVYTRSDLEKFANYVNAEGGMSYNLVTDTDKGIIFGFCV